MGDGDGAPNGAGVVVPPKGDADDNPPVVVAAAPKGELDATFPPPNGDCDGAVIFVAEGEIPKAEVFVDGVEEPNGD